MTQPHTLKKRMLSSPADVTFAQERDQKVQVSLEKRLQSKHATGQRADWQIDNGSDLMSTFKSHDLNYIQSVPNTFWEGKLHSFLKDSAIYALATDMDICLGFGDRCVVENVIRKLEMCRIYRDNAALWSVCARFATYTWMVMEKPRKQDLIELHMLSCAIIVQKIYVDDSFDNVYFAKKFGVKLFSLNACEVQILNALRHQIPFDYIEQEYDAFSQNLDCPSPLFSASNQ